MAARREESVVSPAMLSASSFWQRVRTPYGSLIAIPAIVAFLMALVGDRLLL